MKVVTEQEFHALAGHGSRYYANRWPYFKQAGEIVTVLNLCGKVIEIGPYKFPLVHDSHTMDVSNEYHPSYLHDASKFPWPIADKAYELLVALQVWEHLRPGSQEAAFREACRVARWLLMSFPLDWHCPQDAVHHGITEAVIADWTCEHERLSWLVGGRLLCLFHPGA